MKLRESQQIALEKLTEEGRTFGALWAEPRSGKTAVALSWLGHIRPKVAVIVGPKIAEITWKSEPAKWLKVPYRFFPLTSGNEYPSKELWDFEGISLFFVNYEQFGSRPFKKLKPFLASVAKDIGGEGAMLLDESHLIKTPRSIQGRNIRPLASQWRYRLLMTGTPVTNPSQIDAVYGQWTFLDPSIRDKWPSARAFRDHFGEWSTVKGFPELIRPRNQYELNQYLQPHVVTMTGAGEPVPIEQVFYKIPRDTMITLDSLYLDGVAQTQGRTVVALNPLTRLLRMRQVVAGWCTDDEGVAFTIKESALARLKALWKTLGKCKGKVIIACTHLREISLVGKLLRKKRVGYLTITGQVKDKEHVIQRFQSDLSVKVLLVQPRTVSMAVDISVANDLIWYSADFNYVTFKQASDRIKLSPAKPTVYFLTGAGSVDHDVWITLQEDHDHLQKTVEKIRSKK